jgi:hypothetical protein
VRVQDWGGHSVQMLKRVKDIADAERSLEFKKDEVSGT